MGVAGCTDDNPEPEPDPGTEKPAGTYAFPQGVASGDPRATSVVLWTRAALASAGAIGSNFPAIIVRVQVFTDADRTLLVVDKKLAANAVADHTVRVLVTGLAPATTYYYRFTAGADRIDGQTRTAPAADADVKINLAWVSCQDYTAGHYSAYRQMIADDTARPEADKIHAVVHLGDMIYETRADPFQVPLDDDFNRTALTNRDGTARVVAAFPSETDPDKHPVVFATTVDDYRHLYKTFLSDPDIQAARARWPFISIWDDHEFTDDCWQSQANYTDDKTGDEGSQTRRVAASQAWFEYIPVQLTGADGVAGVPSEAKDFAPTSVKNAAFTAPDADNFVDEPNNAAAVGAITIYRSFRFGKHVELVMTDERSYRSDHAVPEEITTAIGLPLFFVPRNVLPLPLVKTLDEGSTANNNNPPDEITLIPDLPNMPGVHIPNTRKASPPGTMLGKQQKEWWKATMKKSDATWKLWGNEVTLMRLKIPPLGPTDPADRVLAADSWDGYPTERKELMTFLREESIKNVVVLSGDIHAAFAGTIDDDFDAPTRSPVACELVGPGVTSNSLFSFFEFASRLLTSLRPLVTVDTTAKGGAKFTENFNLLMLHGTVSAGAFAQFVAMPNVSIADALQIATGVGVSVNPNPHLKYVDTNAQGYGYVQVTADQVAAQIVTINRPIGAPTDAPGIKRTASFTIPKDNPAGMTTTITGTKPFPII